MEFRNKKTGTVVETKVELTGNWEPVKNRRRNRRRNLKSRAEMKNENLCDHRRRPSAVA